MSNLVRLWLIWLGERSPLRSIRKPRHIQILYIYRDLYFLHMKYFISKYFICSPALFPFFSSLLYFTLPVTCFCLKTKASYRLGKIREGKEREEPRGLKLIIDPYSSLSLEREEEGGNIYVSVYGGRRGDALLRYRCGEVDTTFFLICRFIYIWPPPPWGQYI